MSRLARFAPMLQEAVAGGYAVPAFNVYSLESMVAALQASRAEQAPVILALGERYFGNMRPLTARAILESLLELAPADQPPAALHLDHCADPALCREALRAGFSSVMIDASSRAFRENLSITRAVVREAHACGAGVEAELGGLAAGEASHEFDSGEETLTDPAQALAFVQETEVDALAVSVGTVHGLYKGEPKIDLPRLARIHELVRIPLVLHGGSGTPEELLRAAIGRGVAKVNVNTEIAMAGVARIRQAMEAKPKLHLSEVGAAAIPAMEEVMREYIRRFNASGTCQTTL